MKKNNETDTMNLINNNDEMFFSEQDKKVNNLINTLIDFRLNKQPEEKQEIKKFFRSLKIRAAKLGYDELSKVGEYYEKRIESAEEISENSHEIFSDILKGTAIIKNHIKKLKIDTKKNFININISKSNTEIIEEKINILVLDEDIVVASILKDAFEVEGYNVIATTNPEEAIEYILYKNINIGLMDIKTPKTNGFEVFEVLKKNGLEIPIIFLSGKSMIDYKVEALSRGAEDYITKPFEIKEVVARVKRSLGRTKQYKNKLNRDNLTGAYNKEYFNEKLKEIISQYECLKQDYSVAFMDLDDFKYINDNYGHIIGDYALKDFSFFLKNNLDENDIVFRFGGDEFIVLFVNKDTKQAYKDIERLRKKLNKSELRYKDVEDVIKLNISVGITYITKDDDVEEVLKRADKCLYSSKQLGKNTTICCSDYDKS